MHSPPSPPCPSISRGEFSLPSPSYADERGVFQDKGITLLQEAAAAVSFALENLGSRVRAAGRRKEAPSASEEQFRAIANYTVD